MGSLNNVAHIRVQKNKIGVSNLRPLEVDVINDTAFIMCTSGSTGPSKG